MGMAESGVNHRKWKGGIKGRPLRALHCPSGGRGEFCCGVLCVCVCALSNASFLYKMETGRGSIRGAEGTGQGRGEGGEVDNGAGAACGYLRCAYNM